MIKNQSSKSNVYRVTVFLLLAMLLNNGVAFAQWSFLRSMFLNQNVYKTKEEIKLIRVYNLEDGKAVDESQITYTLKLDSVDFVRYRILVEGDKPFIKVLPAVKFIPMANNAVDILVTYKDDPYFKTKSNPVKFIFKLKDDTEPSQKYMATERITGLPITLPVKFRKLNGDVQTSLGINIGYAFGWKIRVNDNPYKENYINIIPYAFSLAMDQYFVRKLDGSFTEKEDAFSLTYAAMGLTYQFNKTNVGIFTGWDRMFNDQTDWIYQKKSWLSLGLGYKLGD